MTTAGARRELGRLFDEVADLYDRVRPTYPDAIFADLVDITGIDHRARLLEVGCGTGQATGSLAALGCDVTAVEAGDRMASLARERLRVLPNVVVETSAFETWDARGRQFDVIVAAASWHWIDPAVGWKKAYDLLKPGGWMALIGNVVVRRAGDREVYAETADLHERFRPRAPAVGSPSARGRGASNRRRMG
ncbi:MAG TPA: class I SAM-dependent methyltransferase [Acidimicrobiales bacterium]|nr:class I SAM-dependent methyltransferase [Acidimicrobiales bacterium]